jgi:uncharacterized protein (DUF1501 family)
MEPLIHPTLCGLAHGRRAFLRALGFAGAGWLTPVGSLLAAQSEKSHAPAKSIIMICLQGGPSQLETFDPKPDKSIAGGTKAIKTAVKDVELAEGFGQLAELMGDVSLVRSLMSKEGDHERGVYQLKTGYRPEPTIEHASIGAIFCHEVQGNDPGIPRHVSILPGQWPARGGYLGGEFDAFQVDDPLGKLPDVTSSVKLERAEARLRDLDVVERAFARGRARRVEETLHRETTRRARVMMDSEQLRAFDISQEPAAIRAEYGDTAFGRACLAARRLTEVGVRCIEVTLDGWDSHVNNHETHRARLKVLDPALAALIRDLKRRRLLEQTVVLCAGEFGRTPKINPLGGRDHWPTGYSIALAGGGIAGGRVIGKTDDQGVKDPTDPHTIADVHATILKAVGLDPRKENIAPKTLRPIKLSEGKVISGLLG